MKDREFEILDLRKKAVFGAFVVLDQKMGAKGFILKDLLDSETDEVSRELWNEAAKRVPKYYSNVQIPKRNYVYTQCATVFVEIGYLAPLSRKKVYGNKVSVRYTLTDKARSTAEEYGLLRPVSETVPATPEQRPAKFFLPPYANWERIEGDGVSALEQGDIVCRFIDVKDWMPDEFLKIKSTIAEHEESKANKPGSKHAWAGKGFGILSFYPYRTELERPKLFLTFKPTDYFDFLATNFLTGYLRQNPEVAKRIVDDLHGLELIREYSSETTPMERPILEFANHFSVGMTVLTSDDPPQMIIVERSPLAVWPGLPAPIFHTSVAETMLRRREKGKQPDVDDTEINPDPFKTAFRGASEELGIQRDEIEDVRFLVFGYHPPMYQYHLFGMMTTSLTYERINESFKWRSHDRFETRTLHGIRFDEFSTWLGGKRWSDEGLVGVFYTLVNKLGYGPACNIFSRPPDNVGF